MSHLDRLFIRALRDQPARGAAAKLDSAGETPKTRPTRVQPEDPVDDARDSGGESDAAIEPTHGAARRIGAQEELYVVPSGKAPATKALSGANARRELLVDGTAGRKQPDVAKSGARDSIPATPTARSPQAAWEIDCYLWPSICRRLETQMDEMLQQLARQILAATSSAGRKVGVTSCVRGEGRSSLLLALARQLSWLSGNLAVLDGDWHHPELASLLQVELADGWEKVLAGHAPWAEAAVRSLREQMVLFPWCGQSEPTMAERSRLDELMPRLEAAYRVLLIDTGPTTRTMRESVPCDHVVVVRDCRRTSDEQVQQAVAKFEFAGIRVLGIVENFAGSLAAGAETNNTLSGLRAA